MPTAASTLIQRTRRYLRDYPELDTLSASLTSSATTVSTTANPADDTYTPNWIIQVDQEAMLVKTAASGSGSITVTRGVWGTTSASHAASATVLVRPAYLDQEILDALNSGLDACFPLLYRPITANITGIVADDYEHDVPNMTTLSVPIPYVHTLEYQLTTDLPFERIRGWRVVRSTTPFLKLTTPLAAGGILRVHGFGPFAHLTSTSDTLDAKFPVQAEDMLPVYAAGYLLGSGEAGRVRVDTGAVDNREQANRVGSSMQAGNALLNRFYRRLNDAAMTPPSKHAVSTL